MGLHEFAFFYYQNKKTQVLFIKKNFVEILICFSLPTSMHKHKHSCLLF